ncbi:endonuclease/exonuclease/phosphatase family protein [Aurantibacter crassamenti]|uniref:endonuclease/exonuclease/phosphatase family protein n=1 Tax=Aurantibacter crassamenti TaxID=1837375 RepID=UPI00193A6A0E|nr:endonuclease/exonuclease/phosphatase family protein [Aurantibacter crassamenti]MBM1106896.1 endonuclease/exonuclease/phosphatase family protein [Aurantibacter crassamenti]
MKILTWNCNGALRNKIEYLDFYKADIYIIQECENPAKAKHKDYSEWASNYLWIGDNKNRGIGIFAKSNITLEKLDWSDTYQNHKVKHFLPCSVNSDFILLAVWTHNNNSPTFGYIGQLWKYLQINKSRLKNCFVIGDFNSNKNWDKWDRWWNHSDVVSELNEIGITSLYHQYSNEKQGEESKPTFFLQRKIEKAYHIDYVFTSLKFVNRLIQLEIGEVNKWIKISDHLPIICTFDN